MEREEHQMDTLHHLAFSTLPRVTSDAMQTLTSWRIITAQPFSTLSRLAGNRTMRWNNCTHVSLAFQYPPMGRETGKGVGERIHASMR